jgi:3-oxoacyl-(acyl-carrier-protein) synthase
MIAGGAESPISRIGWPASACKALSTARNDDPDFRIAAL